MIPVWLGYVASFLGGGLAGALANRYFSLRDRAIKKLTLKIEKEEVKSIIPITINSKPYHNLIAKKFTLINSTDKDFPELDIVFEFDKGSEIVFKEVTSPKHGRNKFDFTERKPSELVYHIKNFNRKQKVTFSFEVANITENFFCPMIDNCGVDITIIHSQTIIQPSISPSKIVTKLDLE
jgi:hypothetical protein